MNPELRTLVRMLSDNKKKLLGRLVLLLLGRLLLLLLGRLLLLLLGWLQKLSKQVMFEGFEIKNPKTS